MPVWVVDAFFPGGGRGCTFLVEESRDLLVWAWIGRGDASLCPCVRLGDECGDPPRVGLDWQGGGCFPCPWRGWEMVRGGWGIHWARGGFALHVHSWLFVFISLYVRRCWHTGFLAGTQVVFVFHFKGAGSRRLVVTEGSASGIGSCSSDLFVEVVITVAM